MQTAAEERMCRVGCLADQDPTCAGSNIASELVAAAYLLHGGKPKISLRLQFRIPVLPQMLMQSKGQQMWRLLLYHVLDYAQLREAPSV